jgi:hypothetical protein
MMGAMTSAIAMMAAKGKAASMERVHSNVDVVIVGGGTAGAIAALQSGLLGAETLVLEQGSQLGGTMTTGGVWAPGLFFAHGRQVIAGLGWGLVLKTLELEGGSLPDFAQYASVRHSALHVRINGQLYAALAEEACVEVGVHLAYYESPHRAEATEDGWRIVSVGKGLERTVTCRQIVDCTGGANLVGMLGYPRMREGTTQPGTTMFRLGGYDVRALDLDEIEGRFQKALVTGELRRGDVQNPDRGFARFLLGGGANQQHLFDVDDSTSAAHTATNIRGRRSVLRILRFVRSLPGCENAHLEYLAPETAVRETYRIRGEAVISRDDYVTGRIFPDAICYAFYPVDLHDEDGIVPRPLAQDIVPTIPLRALVPKGSRNLLVAGRSVSSDRLANSGLRVQASCMAMGQAAGAIAALSARKGLTPLELSLEVIRDVLRAHGGIVPG